jgi:hypothetical protein
MAYLMDFTPEANKRMNPKPFSFEDVIRPPVHLEWLINLSMDPNRDCFR